MGLFSKLFSKRSNEPVQTEAFVVENFQEDFRAARPADLAEEGDRVRKEKLVALGVDASIFTPEKTMVDSMVFLHEFVPLYKRFDIDFTVATISGLYQNLTKAGKIPKNVFKGSYCADGPQRFTNTPADSAIVHISYLKDGSANLVDIHLWHKAIKHSVSIRPSKDGFEITFVEKYDMRKDLRDTLFLKTSSELSTGDPFEILERSVLEVLGS